MTRHRLFGDFAPDPLDFETLDRKAASHPFAVLDQCRSRRRAIKRGVRALEWEVYVACYASARVIRNDPEFFEDLRTHEYFEHRTYKVDIKNVLRLAVMIGTDADIAGPTYKNACYVAGRMQPFFDLDIDPDVLMGAIEYAGGFKRLREVFEGVEDDTAGKATKEEHDLAEAEPDDLSPTPSSQQTGSVQPPGRPARREPQHQAGDHGTLKPDEPEPPKRADIILEVVVTETMLQEVIDSPLGAKARLIVTHVLSASNWQRIEAISATVIT